MRRGARARAFGRQVNFGFEKVERLPGNVGYLELRSFGFEPEWIGDAAAAAFDFLVNTEALIIHVRRNGGGSPGMVAFVSSYLFPITNTNWERVGVRPDVAVSSDQALRTAHLAALRVLREGATEPERRRQLDEAIAEVEGRP